MIFTTTLSKGSILLPDVVARNATAYCLGISQYKMKEIPRELIYLCVDSVESSYCNGESLPSLGPLLFQEATFERPALVPFRNVVERELKVWVRGNDKIEGIVTLVLEKRGLGT
jgi:hypothetical protein